MKNLKLILVLYVLPFFCFNQSSSMELTREENNETLPYATISKYINKRKIGEAFICYLALNAEEKNKIQSTKSIWLLETVLQCINLNQLPIPTSNNQHIEASQIFKGTRLKALLLDILEDWQTKKIVTCAEISEYLFKFNFCLNWDKLTELIGNEKPENLKKMFNIANSYLISGDIPIDPLDYFLDSFAIISNTPILKDMIDTYLDLAYFKILLTKLIKKEPISCQLFLNSINFSPLLLQDHPEEEIALVSDGFRSFLYLSWCLALDPSNQYLNEFFKREGMKWREKHGEK